MIQIRNVPVELHRKLKARAALAGQSLSDYLLSEIERAAEVPTRAEMIERLRRLPRVPVGESAASALEDERRRREPGPVRRRAARRAARR